VPSLPCGVAADHGFCDDGVCSTTSSDDRYERAVNSDDIIRGKRCVSVGDSAAYEAMVRPRRRTSSPNVLRGWCMLLTRGARGPHSGRALGWNSALSKNKNRSIIGGANYGEVLSRPFACIDRRSKTRKKKPMRGVPNGGRRSAVKTVSHLSKHNCAV
jgi:hypothetical protein